MAQVEAVDIRLPNVLMSKAICTLYEYFGQHIPRDTLPVDLLVSWDLH